VSVEHTLFIVAVLVILSILASKASFKLGVPSLLLFLVLGMLAGSEGIGGIYFDNPHQAQFLGVVALVYILFSGGLDTDWRSVRPVLWQGLSLSTIGVALTAGILGCFCHLMLGLSLLEGLLLGAIVSSTDAAAVFAVLRSRRVSLRGSLKPLLELESGSNDPMAVFLTMGLITLVTDPSASIGELGVSLIQQLILGSAVGYAFGRGMVLCLNRVKLEYEGLYPVFSLALVALAYTATNLMGGNGFLAVYLVGLTLGHHDFIHKKSLVRFHDGVAWLMQIAMFVALGLLVFPSRLLPVIGMGLVLSAVLAFIARPASVFVGLLCARTTLREKALVSWVGLRGSVPIILATFPLVAGVPRAELFFNVVFFAVLTSVLVQGTTIPFVARWLGVEGPLKPRTRSLLDFEPIEGVETDLREIVIPKGAEVAGKALVQLQLPSDSLIALISRGDQYIVPSGPTILEEGDVLWALLKRGTAGETVSRLSRQKPERSAEAP
jgi:cell volume regulation protein A